MYLTLVRFSLQGKDLIPLYSITTPWRIPLDMGPRDVPTRGPVLRTLGFLFFFGTIFFSFHKEKKKVTKRFEMKEKF
jgi:hypothetical protein